MHDLRNNSTYNVRNPHQSCIIANIDSLLKKVSQEYARLSKLWGGVWCVGGVASVSAFFYRYSRIFHLPLCEGTVD